MLAFWRLRRSLVVTPALERDIRARGKRLSSCWKGKARAQLASSWAVARERMDFMVDTEEKNEK